MNLFGNCGQNKREKYSKKFAIETVWWNFVDKRSEFSSKVGFVMAAGGSAGGLGNIWRFPYVMGENGGAACQIWWWIVSDNLPDFCIDTGICDHDGRTGNWSKGSA